MEEVVPMANRTMEELLQAPTEGYGEAIVIPEILAENFEIKTNLLQLVQTNKFHGFERDNPHTHISNFKRMTSTLKYRDVPNDAIKLMLFPYSLDGAARIWYEKEPPNSILTWDDLVNKFVNQFFPPSITTHLKNEISRFTQRFEETFGEAWEHFKEMLRACPHHGFSEDSSSKTDDRIDKLADQISNLVEIVNKQVITPNTAKAVEKTCVICRGVHAYYDCIAIDSNQSSVCAATGTYNQVSPPNRASNQMPPPGFAPVQNKQNQGNNFNRGNNFQRSFFQNQASTLGTLPSNTVPNPKGEMKAVTTRSGLAYEGPSIPTNSPLEKVVERETEETMEKEQHNCQGSTTHIQPLVVPTPIPEPDVPKNQPKPNIPYPSRLNDQKLREKTTNQMEKFFQIFHDLHFDISFADALLLMPKIASTIKSLLTNKDKLFELAKVLLNENCLAMLLKKLLEKLGDPGKFLIPCDFTRIDVCHALADLGASINLMPLSIWKKLSLPKLTPTRMTLELEDRSITHPKGVADDVFVKVRKFHFPTDFVVVDFEADPRVPLILGRSFLRTGRALIDVFGEEITLRVNDESVTFNLNQTMRYSSTYDDNSVNRVDVINIACEEFVQDVLDFQYNSKSSNPTLVSNPLFSKETKSEFCKEPIVKSSSPTLTPFGESDFFLEQIEDFLKDESIPTGIEDSFYDLEGDLLYLEKLLNDDPSQLPLMDLKQAKQTKAKSSIEEPPELELKELPSHLEYAFLEEADKLPVIIAKDLKDVEKEALLKVLKSHKRAIAWKISDIKGIDPRFCTHKILMEEDYKPAVQSQRWVNPKIHDVIKKEVIKLLDAEMIYPIFDSPWMDSRVISKSRLIPKTKRKQLSHALMELSLTVACPSACVMSRIKVDRAKVDVIAKLPHPTTVKGVRSFLGHAGFYRRFIQDFSKIARPVTRLLENETPFVFFKDCIDAFETLKENLTEAPILVVPDWNLPFELMCDASDIAIGNKYSLVAVDYLSKWVEAKALPTNDARFVVKFFKSLFSRFGTPKAIISDCRTYFCNDQFARVMTKYGVTHRLATAYHPQTSGQVEFSNRGLKRILERTVGENRASWLDKLDAALWAFHTTFKTPIGCTPYKLVYGKSCHLPIELEHKAYWALKHVNFDLKTTGDHRKLQLNELNELNELRDQAYKNSLIYKERTKKLHDSKIKNRIFNVGDQVLLFNSRLKIFSGKLKTHWSGPFTITQVFPYGTVELSQPNGPNFIVNGHHVKHYFGGDIPSKVVLDLHTIPIDK
nr:reverse transcriptase domain-containing protein [Tanacetum cinerariifolium]